ncbi:MAG: hypothetical protein NT133_26890 [Alphaproteobacteria bacterium]|nr:hypothetical protein [Alphaproteobacteria bacterium]
MDYLPHISMFLRALRINRERLSSKSKVAVDAKILRQLLQSLAAAAPFSEAFYLEQNPDVAEAHAKGQIADLRSHFIEQGYFEGRAGSVPPVDEEYYITAYPDVAEAVRRGDVSSGAEHYTRSGAAEARIPSPHIKPAIESWVAALRDETIR